MTTLGDGLEGPPEGAVALGGDHFYTRGVDKAGVWIAIHEWHKRPDNGLWCVGYVPFNVQSDYWVPRSPHWDVLSTDPLTLHPSLLCDCGSHGFIREGKWVGA